MTTTGSTKKAQLFFSRFNENINLKPLFMNVPKSVLLWKCFDGFGGCGTVVGVWGFSGVGGVGVWGCGDVGMCGM